MNLNVLIIYLLAILPFSALAQEQKLTASEINTFKRDMAAQPVVKTLVADFTQFKKVGFVKNDIISTGKFYVKHPDKLAWYYTSPTNYKMIFNDRKIFINEKGKTKTLDLGRSKQFEKISQAIQANLGEGSFDSADFKTTYLQTAHTYIVQLEPSGKEVKKALKQLRLTLDKTTFRILEINLVDPAGGYTKFKLENHKINTRIDDKIFVL